MAWRALLAGVVVGLTLGAAVGVRAQRDQEPCARAWILWDRVVSAGSASAWAPGLVFSTEEACDRHARVMRPQAQEALDKNGGTTWIVSTQCYPDTFDPRPRTDR